MSSKNNKNTLFRKNFTRQKFEIPNDFVYFRFGNYVGDDATVTQNHCTGLVIQNPTFTKRSTGIVDHVKYLTVTKNTFEAPCNDTEIFVQALMTFTPLNIVSGGKLTPGLQKYSDGIQNVQDEPRVSAGAMNLVDLSTGMIFDFIFSDQTVYALYEHLPVSSDTSIFTQAVPVMSRPADLNKLYTFTIGYNRCKNQANWYIDGTKVFTVNNVGLIPIDKSTIVTFGGCTSKEVEIKSISAGFGLFTLLDFFPFPQSYEQIGQSYTINPANSGAGVVPIEPLANVGSIYFKRMLSQLGTPVPQTDFIYDGPNNQPDGQGGLLNIKKFKIGTRKAYCA